MSRNLNPLEGTYIVNGHTLRIVDVFLEDRLYLLPSLCGANHKTGHFPVGIRPHQEKISLFKMLGEPCHMVLKKLLALSFGNFLRLQVLTDDKQSVCLLMFLNLSLQQSFCIIHIDLPCPAACDEHIVQRLFLLE